MKALWILPLILLISCGGGGNENPAPTPTPTPIAQEPIDPNLTVPVLTAFANVMAHGFDQTFTISGTSEIGPITGSGRLIRGKGEPTSICSGDAAFVVPAASEVVTGTMTAGGISTPFTNILTVYYHGDGTTFAIKGNGQLMGFEHVAYPETVRAGDTGPTGAGLQYDEATCKEPILASTSTGVYTVASDRATSLLVTLYEEERNDFVGSVTTESTVVRIDTQGAVSLVSITTTESFQGSVFRTLVFTF